MQAWWCVALVVCARGEARAARPGAGAGGLAAPGQDLADTLHQAIDCMELPDGEPEPDALVSGLRGAGLRGAALCAGGEGCAGALWGRRWLLARAACAARLPLHSALVLPQRDVAGCRNITPDSGAIPVLARFVHPQHAAGAAYDAALLLLAAAAPTPPLANHSRALLHVPQLERWLQQVPMAPSGSEDRERGLELAALRLTSSPLRLLAAAVLAPAAALLLLFALALRLPVAAPAPALLDHDALECAPEPDRAEPEAPRDAATRHRLDCL